jgi:hypothetical protein
MSVRKRVQFGWDWWGSARSPATSIFPRSRRMAASNWWRPPAGTRRSTASRLSRYRHDDRRRPRSRCGFALHAARRALRTGSDAIDAGLHVMLEKPPAATLSEIADLAERASAGGVVLFTTWHSREAAASKPARHGWRQAHRSRYESPGRKTFAAGIPGRNGSSPRAASACSIRASTHCRSRRKILPDPMLLIGLDGSARRPRLAARRRLEMRSGGAKVDRGFDFLQTGPQTWDIEIDTDAGTMRLGMGGSILQLPGGPEQKRAGPRISAALCALRRAGARGESDVDIRPLQIVADAFMMAERRVTEPFAF